MQRISRTAAFFGADFFGLAALLSVWATSTTIGQFKRLTDSVARRCPQDLRPIAQAEIPTDLVERIRPVEEINDLRLDLTQTEAAKSQGDPILL